MDRRFTTMSEPEIPKIEFIRVKDERLRTLFRKVLAAFIPLQAHRVTLMLKDIPSTTMQAQPVIDTSFFRRLKRNYIIHMSPYTKIDPEVKTSDMPEEVVRGWFAHELGHIMDYLNRSWFSLAMLGLGYLLSRRVRIHMERTADLYAIEMGFGMDILATKNFILSHANVSQKYKRQIQKYYLSPAETERILAEAQEAG